MANTKKRTASIADVAKAAKVSVSTVSRVFNRPQTVRAGTLRDVMAAAEALGFDLAENRPGPKPQLNEAKPLLRFLHFVDPREELASSQEAFLLLKRGVERAARKAGCRFLYQALDLKEEPCFDPEDGTAEGYVLFGTRPAKQVEALLHGKPCCWAMTGPWSPDWGDHIMPDHREVGRLAARRLLERGYKKIVMLEGWSDERIHRFREDGFAYEMRTAPEVQWEVVGCKGMDERLGGYVSEAVMADQLADNLARCPLQPQACFVDSDLTLFMMYPRLLKLGFVPGRDFQVVSCNAMESIRQKLPFEFDSIDVHFELIGQLSVTQLLWRIQNPDVATRMRTLVLPKLAIR